MLRTTKLLSNFKSKHHHVLSHASKANPFTFKLLSNNNNQSIYYTTNKQQSFTINNTNTFKYFHTNLSVSQEQQQQGSSSESTNNNTTNNKESNNFANKIKKIKKKYIFLTASTLFGLAFLAYSIKDIILLDEELSEEAFHSPHVQPQTQPYHYPFELPHQIESISKLVRSFITLGIITIDYKLNYNRYDKSSSDKEEEDDEEKALKNIENKSKVHKRSAQRLLQLCLSNGGVFIKAGQHIASLNQILPSEFTDGLRPCQDKASTRPFSVIEAYIRDQLVEMNKDKVLPNDKQKNSAKDNNKKDILYDKYFREIDPTPLAAGSLAQVHVGYLKKSNQKVCIKVQYPDLEKSLKSDLKLLRRLIRAGEYFFKDIKLGWICDEFELNLPFELNFLAEGRNCQLLGEHLKQVKRLKNYVRTPKVYWTHCSEKVLTLEFIDGFKVNDVKSMREKGMDNLDVGFISYLLSHAFSEQIFYKGFIHSDPHPGNIIVSRKKNTSNSIFNRNQMELVIIDHGLYHQLDDEFRLLYCKLWKAIVDYDEKELVQVAKKLGITKNKEIADIANAISSSNSSGKKDVTNESTMNNNKTESKTESNEDILISQLLKTILTARAHNEENRNDLLLVHKQGKNQREASKNKLLQYSQQYFMEITKILGDLDRKMLLLLKCNDLLRSIQMDLGVPVNYFIIFATYAIKAIHKDKLMKVNENFKNYNFLVRNYNYYKTSLLNWKEYTIFDMKLKLFILFNGILNYYYSWFGKNNLQQQLEEEEEEEIPVD
ncbi:hypothetical protein ABK040_006147 [Willaertia magna]